MYDQIKDNLFSANHRNAMIQRYGWTDAMLVTVDDLNFQAFRPDDSDIHDCHLSPEDGCECSL